MHPLTLMPKLDIIQAKCTYGFTQTPLISMNTKLAIAVVVSSTFGTIQTTNQSKWSSTKTQCTTSSQKQNYRHCHVLCSRIWNWLRFNQRKRWFAPSQLPTRNGPHPKSNANLIWQYCHQWHHDWHSCTTQIQSYWHALLLALLLMSTTTKNYMFIENKENTIVPTIHKNIIVHNIIFQFDLLMYSISSKNKQKL